MQIDPSQPIMFDSDTMPGLGAGYWQMYPFETDTHSHSAPVANDRMSIIIRYSLFALIASGLLVGAVGKFLF